MKIGEVRHVWIPKGTLNDQTGDYIQRRSTYPHQTFEELKHGQAPYNAAHACRYQGRWFKLEMGRTGHAFWAGESAYQGPPPQNTSGPKSAPSTSAGARTTTGDVSGRKVDFYFHGYVSDAIFNLSDATLSVMPAYEEYGRVSPPRLLHASRPPAQISASLHAPRLCV
jgi:hypothetical protein